MTLLLLLLAAAVAAPNAGAAAYCINADSFCSGSPANIKPATEAGLEEAIAAANASAGVSDQIYIGAGTIDIDSQLTINASLTNELAIEGVGNGNTNLHFTQPSGTGLYFEASGSLNSGISNLNVQIDGAIASTRRAIQSNGARISGVNFTVKSSLGLSTQGLLGASGASCDGCNFELYGSSAMGMYVASSTTVTNTAFRDASGQTDNTVGITMSSSSGVTVSQTQFIGLRRSITFDGGTVNLRDSIIDMGDQTNARGVYVSNDNNSQSTLLANLDGVTVAGAGNQQRAIEVNAETTNSNGETATANVKNSIIDFEGASTSEIRCVDDDGFGVGTVNIDYSYKLASTPALLGCGGTVGTHNLDSDSYGPADLFVNWAEGDLRLRPAAPVIDQGDPSELGTGRLDALGAARVKDGSGSGTAAIDMGGVEYQDYPPDKPIVGASATSVDVGTAIDFTSSSVDGNGDTVTYSWDFSDGTVSSEQNPTHTFTKDGTFVVQVRASAGGLMSEAGEIEITVNAKAKTDCCSVGAGYTNNFVFNKARTPFKTKKGAKLKNGFVVKTRKPKSGGFIPVTTNAKMSVKLSFEKQKGGYLVGGVCKAKQGKTGSPKRCSLPLKGTQTLELPAGTSYLTFGGKWNRKALTSGRYTLIGVDPDPAAPTTKHTVTVIYKATQGKTGRTK